MDRTKVAHSDFQLRHAIHAKTTTLRAGERGDGSDVDWDALHDALVSVAAQLTAEAETKAANDRAAAEADARVAAAAATMAADLQRQDLLRQANSLQRITLDFPWPDSFKIKGRLIGRDGTQIKRLERQFGCELDVLDGRPFVRITARSEEMLEAAIDGLADFRRELEPWDWDSAGDAHIALDIEVKRFGFLTGRNALTKHSLQDHHRVRMTLVHETMCIRVTGVADADVNAAALGATLLYLDNSLKVEDVLVTYKAAIPLDEVQAARMDSKTLELLEARTRCSVVHDPTRQRLIVFSLSAEYVEEGEEMVREFLLDTAPHS